MSTSGPDVNVLDPSRVAARTAEFQSLLANVGVTNPQPSHSVLQQVLECANQVSNTTVGIVYFADYDRSELVCLAQNGCDDADHVEGPPRYSFDGRSFAARVLRGKGPRFSDKPWADHVGVDQRGVQYFGIRTSMVGVPLKVDSQVLGVLIVWNKNPPGPSKQIIRILSSFAPVAANYLATSVELERRTMVIHQLPSLIGQLQEMETQEATLRALILALGQERFDRVRFFRYDAARRIFVPVDCFNMDRDRFLKEAHISVDRNPYAAHIVRSYHQGDTKARVYPRAYDFGPDPDTRVLDKPDGLAWAVVPIVLNGELIGEIVVDQALTRREITREGLDYLDTVSTLAVGTIANKRSIQFLSLNSLPILYSSLTGVAKRPDVIKRLLGYLSCGQALGFSRAIFMEVRDDPKILVYGASVGSVTEDEFRRIAEIASGMTLGQILANDNLDWEIDQSLKGFRLDLRDPELTPLLADVVVTPITRRSQSAETTPDEYSKFGWSHELAIRIGDTSVLTAPLRVDDGIVGMFLVDRCWQPLPIQPIDTLALRTFAQLAAQILEQNRLQQLGARKRSEQQWENMGSLAAHEISEPTFQIEVALETARILLKQGNFDAMKEYMEWIGDAVAGLKTFIQDFRLITHPILESRPLELLVLLQETVNRILRITPDAFQIQWDLPSEARRIWILGDHAHLKCCFNEILVNSIRAFDKPEKLIRVELSTPPAPWLPRVLDSSRPYALIHFRDNGCGIPPKHRHQIFEPTFTTRREKGGSGMGLFMVKRVIEAHNGIIELVDTDLSVVPGADFGVFLPVIDPPPVWSGSPRIP